MTHDFGLIISDLDLAIALRSFDLGKLLNDLNVYTRIIIYNFCMFKVRVQRKMESHIHFYKRPNIAIA